MKTGPMLKAMIISETVVTYFLSIRTKFSVCTTVSLCGCFHLRLRGSNTPRWFPYEHPVRNSCDVPSWQLLYHCRRRQSFTILPFALSPRRQHLIVPTASRST